MTEQDSTELFERPRDPRIDPESPAVEAKLETLGDAVVSSRSDLLKKGDSIGRYRILGVLGEGGFGVVYLAEQKEPIDRRVALKVIKPGMDTREVIARFEAERQALALMSHSSVAKVFDAGQTEQERPYFVMEHVPGSPITEYCDRQKLTIDQRLTLFAVVCDAIQHAHTKGIIHRDIKPSNILVEVRETGEPVPKVIDFGVAKAMSRRLTAKTLFTEQGRLIGTPEYMSPEQAEMTSEDIDTRSDVYSLGVLLYELLTGALPFERKTLRKAALVEIQRVIREDEPLKPSTRLGTMGDGSAEIARCRQADMRQLLRDLRGDLDWITMKALEKDRTRRYATAAALIEDVQRYLTHQPVHARAPSMTYRFGKVIARNRVVAIATLLVTLAVFGCMVGVTVGFIQASRARSDAEAASAEAVAASERERDQRREAEQVTDFLVRLLTSLDPWETGTQVTVKTALDRAAAGLSEIDDAPAVAATLHLVLGRGYRALDEPTLSLHHLESAVALRERLFGKESLPVAEALLELSNTLRRHGAQFDRARSLELLKRCIAIRRRLLPPNDGLLVDTLGWLNQAQADLGGTRAPGIDDLGFLGLVGGETNEEFLQRLRDELDRQEHLWAQGDRDESYGYFHEAVSPFLRLPGNNAPWAIEEFAWGLEMRGERHDLVEALMYNAARLSDEVPGPTHPKTLEVKLGLFELIVKRRRYGEAEVVGRELLLKMEEVHGQAAAQTQLLRASLANVLIRIGKQDQARAIITELFDKIDETSRDSNASAHQLNGVAWALLTSEVESMRRPEVAMELAQRAAQLLSDEDPSILDTLALAYYLGEQPREAVQMQRRALELIDDAATDRPAMEERLAVYVAALSTIKPGSEEQE